LGDRDLSLGATRQVGCRAPSEPRRDGRPIGSGWPPTKHTNAPADHKGHRRCRTMWGKTAGEGITGLVPYSSPPVVTRVHQEQHDTKQASPSAFLLHGEHARPAPLGAPVVTGSLHHIDSWGWGRCCPMTSGEVRAGIARYIGAPPRCRAFSRVTATEIPRPRPTQIPDSTRQTSRRAARRAGWIWPCMFNPREVCAGRSEARRPGV
jgi:hypothetical protein